MYVNGIGKSEICVWNRARVCRAPGPHLPTQASVDYLPPPPTPPLPGFGSSQFCLHVSKTLIDWLALGDNDLPAVHRPTFPGERGLLFKAKNELDWKDAVKVRTKKAALNTEELLPVPTGLNYRIQFCLFTYQHTIEWQ